MRNELNLFAFALLGVLFMSAFASAFGVSCQYWNDGVHSLRAYAGERVVVPINIQNGAGATENVTARLVVAKGGEIARLQNSEYNVPAGGAVDVLLNVNIPSDAVVGAKYFVRVETQTITPGTAGGLSMGVGAGTEFEVIVVEKPSEAPSSNLVLYLSLAIILVLALIIYLLLKKKKR